MPYTINSTEERVVDGRQTITWNLSGTAVDTTTEVELPIPWSAGTVTHQQATLTSLGSGTATTINPGGGKVSGWSVSDQGEAFLAATTAAHVNEGDNARFSGAVGSIFWNANVDSGSDGTVEALVTIEEGHK